MMTKARRMKAKIKRPCLFVSLPWRELRAIYARFHPELPPGLTITNAELVGSWEYYIGEPRGMVVRRWRHERETDRILLDIEWTPQ